jgi:hypothetical protein
MTFAGSAPGTVRSRRRRDVVGHGDRGHHLAEDGPLLRDVTAEVERAVAQELVEGLALLAAHGLGPGSSSSVR